MPFYKILGLGVSGQGGDAEPGSVIELSERSGKALVDEGLAEESSEGEKTEPAPTNGTQEVVTPQGQPVPEDAAAAAAENERLAKALDAKYNREEGGAKPGLAEAAKEAGVEFEYDASKAEIIQAVIASGKAPSLI